MKKFFARIIAKFFSRVLDVYNDDTIIPIEERRQINKQNPELMPQWKDGQVSKIVKEVFKQLDIPQISAGTEKSKKKFTQRYDILIYAPISNSGLTTQAKQLAKFFEQVDLRYRITYYVPPKIECFLNKHWVEEKDIGVPKAIFFLERFPKFELKNTAYESPKKVFYINLDWLRENELIQGKIWAEYIIFPNEHKNDWVQSTFPKARFEVLKWPSSHRINLRNRVVSPDEHIKILYIGNDYDDKSRKSPFQTIEAIKKCKNKFLRFTLKFRNPLPDNIMEALENHPLVEKVHVGYMTAEKIKNLYEQCHINLIPNQSEGNGLSIIESISEGVIPACLDGFPMTYNVNDSFGYLISALEVQPKVHANQYVVDTKTILDFLNHIDHNQVLEKFKHLYEEQISYFGREKQFYIQLKNLLFDIGLIKVPRLQHVNRQICLLTSSKDIDVFLTTCRRPKMLKPTLERLIEAKEHYYAGDIRISVLIDNSDKETLEIVLKHSDHISIISNPVIYGLPLNFNLILAYEKIRAERSEKFADYICYIQDDCLITDVENYFDIMVDVSENALVEGKIGYVSGFYTPIHPGFELRKFRDYHIILSDSIDGKNIFGHRDLFQEVGRLSWYFNNGERRGNPGPDRGSHFDLWQWKESPNCTMKKGKVNVIIPGLCENQCISEEDSTWGNVSDTENGMASRIKLGQIYNTRPTYPRLMIQHYYDQNRKIHEEKETIIDSDNKLSLSVNSEKQLDQKTRVKY